MLRTNPQVNQTLLNVYFSILPSFIESTVCPFTRWRNLFGGESPSSLSMNPNAQNLTNIAY
jgi:hypothetical protein